MNQREYAHYRGVDPTMVSSWIREGVLEGAYVNHGALFVINPEKADALLKQRLDPSYKNSGKNTPLAKSLSEARARNQAALADMNELKLRQRKGELVEKTKIETEAFTLARQIRDALQNIPDRIGAKLAVESDQAKVHTILSIEIDRALEALSK